MADAPIRGSCLCGGVAFEITGKTSPIGQCHCSNCRKVSGTDGNAVCYTAPDIFRWTHGEELICTYIVPGGNGWHSSFCGTCGSPVPQPNKRQEFYFVPAGLFDDDPGRRGYAAHIWVGSKAPWVEIKDGTPQFSEGFGSGRVDN